MKKKVKESANAKKVWNDYIIVSPEIDAPLEPTISILKDGSIYFNYAFFNRYKDLIIEDIYAYVGFSKDNNALGFNFKNDKKDFSLPINYKYKRGINTFELTHEDIRGFFIRSKSIFKQLNLSNYIGKYKPEHISVHPSNPKEKSWVIYLDSHLDNQ